MSDLLSSTLGAVGQVGDAIDKFTGGRAVRGTLAGKPRELASVIPFSDSLGLTKASDATSGRDLTDSYGITTKGADDFGSHAAGFLADNILSPGNMLGAYGAFKAAPTISKGLTKGAKALSGLDLIDHLGAGAKRVGGFMAGESGAAKIPPLPIDVANMKETSLAANATRPRRYSVDPARKDWYSADRQARFGRHFGGGPGNTSVPSGIPKFSLNDAFHRFANDESGYLRHEIPGVDPELANAMDGLGPMYPGGAAKINSLVDSVGDNRETAHRLGRILRGPDGHGLAGEIPEGSKYLGAGAEGIAIQAPDGSVIRIGDNAPASRPNIPEMLQPYRQTQVGRHSVEHLPRVEPIQDSFKGSLQAAGRKSIGGDFSNGLPPAARGAVQSNNRMADLHDEMSSAMRRQLEEAGHNPWDVTSWNTGLTPEGKAIVYDGGAIKPGEGIRYGAGHYPDRPTFLRPDGDLLARVLAAGGPEKVRESMRAGLADGTRGQGVVMPHLNELLRERASVQDFIRSQGVDAGQDIGRHAQQATVAHQGLPSEVPARSQSAAPSLPLLLGAMGATSGAGGLLAYLLNGNHQER